MSENTNALLDRAATGREIGKLVAIVLIARQGDPDAALDLLSEFEGVIQPESVEELDAVPIAQQAIREAVDYLTGGSHA